MAKVLVVEDDLDLADTLKDLISAENYVVDVVYDGEQAVSYLNGNVYDIAVLDVQLPKLSGIDVLKMIRASNNRAAVIMLTTRSETADKLEGLDSGADDYLTKPFQPDELLARIRALLRRASKADYTEELVAGELKLNIKGHTCTKAGKDIKLQPREFALLEFFMRHQNEVFSDDALLDRVWATDSEVTHVTLRVVIANLRSKINVSGERSLIETVHRQGYKFSP